MYTTYTPGFIDQTIQRLKSRVDVNDRLWELYDAAKNLVDGEAITLEKWNTLREAISNVPEKYHPNFKFIFSEHGE
jgi:hypothetical protein